jgi:hypothetical protein
LRTKATEFFFYIIWDVTPCTPLKINRHFGETCHSAWCLLYAGFLFGLFFDPEDGGNIFLAEVDRFSTDYTALYSRR